MVEIEGNQEIKALSVGEAIDYLNRTIRPIELIVQGEIGEKIDNYPHGSYFDLLDKKGEAVLHCLIWKNNLEKANIELKKGKEVKILGYSEIYKKSGDFKIIVRNISVVGEGELKKAFEKLKKKLSLQGFFAVERKKEIPRFCKKIGLITSQYGRGALPDFKKHLGNYGFEIYFYDVRVEGIKAINDISRSINWFNRNISDIDVIALIRGGGSWESLQAFNSEEVAKSIFASKIPIICGVGHEKDETIADYVADVRASTPTDVGKILSRNWELASANIYDFERNILSLIKRLINEANIQILNFKKVLTKDLEREIKIKKEGINSLTKELSRSFKAYFERFRSLEESFKRNILKIKIMLRLYRKNNSQMLTSLLKNKDIWIKSIKRYLVSQSKILNANNPELKLQQGYSLTLDESGKIIKNINDVKIGQSMKTKLYKGQIISKVEQKNAKRI